MFNNSYKLIFMMTLMFSTILIISSNTWISMWMGLEINLLSFIPLLNNNKLMSSEASLKYFLIQTIASSILLLSIILIMNNFFFMKMMITTSLLLKMGTPPFHFWLLSIIEGLSWFNVFIMLTWQKIAPMMILSLLSMNPMIMISMILSSLIGAIGGINQTSMRKLISYSSINHMSWMIYSLMNNIILWTMYLILYSIILIPLIYLFNSKQIYHINQLSLSFISNKYIKIMLMINLLSLGGLPPFTGFFPKWMLINLMTINNQFLLSIIMILCSLITLFFYIRMTYSTLLINSLKINWLNSSYQSKHFLMILISLSLFSLILLPSFFLV
uniref:NADH-ubiquinone oxidoreductase chain 2 n=1 Tax=Paradyschiria parvula TaxID=2572155 RepID=A0A5B9RFK3_9MUSC|nr:NADH dehydrogenase subunit 2 [Paradyschiria parvula]QEG77631.1 NADH dehydrogenase subunit 2 [Paradyschiria parvula]